MRIDLRIYKDVEPQSDGFQGRSIKYSDYYGRRKDLVFDILTEKYENIEFISPSFFDSRWNILYLLLLLIARAKNKYIVETKSSVNVNYRLIWYICLSVLHFLFQFLFVILYVLVIVCLLISPKTKKDLSNKHDFIFLRTKLVRNLTAGGSLGHIIGVINGLVKNGINVDYFGFDTSIEFDESVTKTELKIGKFSLGVPFFSQIYFSLRCILLLSFSHYDSIKNKIIYYRPVSFDITALAASIFFRVPLIIEFNSFLVWEEKNNGSNSVIKHNVIGFLERLHLKRASMIVCVSEVLRQDLISAGYAESKIVVVPNGVNIDKFTPHSRFKDIYDKLGIKEEIVVGFVGTFGPWHGIELLTETILRYSTIKDRDIKFILVGDGQLRRECQNRLNHLPNVVFTGKISYEHIEKYLAGCDILLSPHSLQVHEKEFIGSPTKLFEYMSMGKIVIGTKIGQLIDIVNPALERVELSTPKSYNKLATGILVHPNVDELVESLQKVVLNIEDLRYLGYNARMKAVHDYSWRARMKLMLDSFFQCEE